eukprot:274205-Chlamydomonas_euryale.AAC.1
MRHHSRVVGQHIEDVAVRHSLRKCVGVERRVHHHARCSGRRAGLNAVAAAADTGIVVTVKGVAAEQLLGRQVGCHTKQLQRPGAGCRGEPNICQTERLTCVCTVVCMRGRAGPPAHRCRCRHFRARSGRRHGGAGPAEHRVDGIGCVVAVVAVCLVGDDG